MDEFVLEREIDFAEDTCEMILEADAYMRSLYPPENCFGFKPKQLQTPKIHFFVARHQGVAAGCAGIMICDEDPDCVYTEVKRMYVKPAFRGKGLAKRLMANLIDETRRLNISLMRLETGVRQPEAIALYESFGFTKCSAFGHYPETDVNIFYEKRLEL